MARQKEEVGRPFTVRIRSAQLAELEAWMAREGEVGLSHQKAILRLVTAGIRDVKVPRNLDVMKIADVTKERVELEAERDALRDEVDNLRRQLAELEDIPAAAAPGVTTIEVKDAKIAQAIAGLMEKKQLVNVINAGIRSVKAASAPAPESEKITTPEVAERTVRSIIEEVYKDYVEGWDDECDDNEREALRAARDEMLAEGLYQETAHGFRFLYDKHLKRIRAEVKKTEADAKKTEAKAKRLAAIAERRAKAASAAASAAVVERRLKAKARDDIIANSREKALDDAELAMLDAELEAADFPMPEIPEVVETPIVEKIEEVQ